MSRRHRPRLEELEPRQLLNGSQPTAMEQLFLERLNDARADPAAYGASIGLDLSGVAPSQPLAFSTLLVQAAQQHSQDMNARNYFSHYTPEGLGPGQRITNAGFTWTGYGESIAGGTAFPDNGAALAGLIIDSGVYDLGHRRHLLAMDALYANQNQVGIGIVQGGTGVLANYYTIDTAAGLDTRPFLTGVVFNDLNGNSKYDLGEGLAGVTITVAGVGSFTDFDSGGYATQLNPGTYTVTASGGGLTSPITRTVTVGTTNYRLNFSTQDNSYIQKLYQGVLGRPASAAEVNAWVQVLQGPGGPGAVAVGVEHSAEAFTRRVRGWYQTYLGRSAVGGEEQGWVRLLLGGFTEEQVLAGILGSAEYCNRARAFSPAASADQSLVQALFQQLLGRPAGAAEVNAFVRTVLPGMGPGGVAWVILESPEYRGDMVRTEYRTLLHRSTAPGPVEVNGWVYSGLDLGSIRCGFEASPEYLLHG
jgi:uncharacterized protein YkwD